MGEQGISRAAFASQVHSLTETIKAGCGIDNTGQQLQQAVTAVCRLIEMSEPGETVSFGKIGEKLEELLLRYADSPAGPSLIEIEVIELACDWLLQLSSLYREALPQPQALVADLLNTFALVTHATGAQNLADLIAFQRVVPEQLEPDLFADDPLVDVPPTETVRIDPFASDPGFSVELDLLQKTSYEISMAQMPADDPFGDDPLFSTEFAYAAQLGTQGMPYDVFSEDPDVAPS